VQEINDLFDFVFVVFGGEPGLFAELALDVAPDLVAGVADGFEEAAGSLSDGLEVADEGRATGFRRGTSAGGGPG